MNAISMICTTMPKQKLNTVERLANYLRELAKAGKGCASNNTTIAARLGMSGAQVRAAKAELVRKKRLIGAWQIWVSIDGVMFGTPEINDIEAVKMILRRRFGPTYDPRTLQFPDKAVKGIPKELVVDGRTVPWAECKRLAGQFIVKDARRG